ncbi:uncharacterized protein BYT42DRAFT_584681 [Radiomyces spectabilis]|uniref:uncharacterized protein n=1 Tax=Radiomyces spectabilis TaxID=64574 RepID=UPI0022207F18|nr:uncharacterized protein BYT42DRAFT_584681 [Radiomyces spectabilis]KAI8369496.1 hypothetical protein BYT42DRAFT_584681 [Radiomyces spectabilis]
MYQEIGLLCVLLLPILVIHWLRTSDTALDSLDRRTAKKKNKKKKAKSRQPVAQTEKAATSTATNIATEKDSDRKAHSASLTSSGQAKQIQQKKQAAAKSSLSPSPTPSPSTKAQTKAKDKVKVQERTQKDAVKEKHQDELGGEEQVKEIDEHMDPTARYARVLRIKADDEEEAFSPVPYEEGWSQVPVSSSSSHVSRPASQASEPLTKKQRENMARAAKKKQQKANADALQAERLRRHQKQLEQQKIAEFYSKGAGKHTPWGSQGKKAAGSSKTPSATAALNEHGQLIWD